MAKAKRDPQPRVVWPILTVAQQLAIGTGHHADMVCKDCGRTGCLNPLPHDVATRIQRHADEILQHHLDQIERRYKGKP